MNKIAIDDDWLRSDSRKPPADTTLNIGNVRWAYRRPN